MPRTVAGWTPSPRGRARISGGSIDCLNKAWVIAAGAGSTQGWALATGRGGTGTRIDAGTLINRVTGACGELPIRGEEDIIWLVSFMQHDIGYFDLEACRVEPVDNPFGPKVLSMSPV